MTLLAVRIGGDELRATLAGAESTAVGGRDRGHLARRIAIHGLDHASRKGLDQTRSRRAEELHFAVAHRLAVRRFPLGMRLHVRGLDVVVPRVPVAGREGMKCICEPMPPHPARRRGLGPAGRVRIALSHIRERPCREARRAATRLLQDNAKHIEVRHIFAEFTRKQPAHPDEALQELLRAEQRAMARHEPRIGLRGNKIVVAGDDEVFARASKLEAIMRQRAVRYDANCRSRRRVMGDAQHDTCGLPDDTLQLPGGNSCCLGSIGRVVDHV